MKADLKPFAVLAAATLLFAAGCTGGTDPNPDVNNSSEETTISLWTYPVGGWGNPSSVSPVLSAFHRANPRIRVSLKVLDYTDGDRMVEEAISSGEFPDLVLEGPERFVANWGARGLMAPLDDVMAETKGVNASVDAASKNAEGTYFIYPVCMTTHCMAINYDLFREAGALSCIDEETHTWTTEDFFAAVEAIRTYQTEQGKEQDVAVLYCNGQGGDQGTRALVNNLYGGTFTNAEHTGYTVDSPENIEALQRLAETDGIRFAPDMTGSDEQTAFCEGKLAMAFCWNVAAEVNMTVKYPDFAPSIFPMAFPAKEGNEPSLQGGIWGFGIFKSDEKRVAAAKTFIRFIGENYTQVVKLSSYLPVRSLDRDPYENDKLMMEYATFSKYLGDYYQITTGWAEARTAWWKALQIIAETGDVASALKNFPNTESSAASL